MTNRTREESEKIITRYEWVVDREGFLVRRDMEIESMKAEPKGHLR